MRIISWNTNGLRATVKQGFWAPVLAQKPDILCLQEVKAEPEQLPEEVRNLAGYFSYFSHSKIKKGYSGVAIYTKFKPEKVEYGMGIPKFDDEGRVLVAYFKDFILLNVYFPQGGREGRLEYKLDFYDAFLKFLEKSRKKYHNPPSHKASEGRRIIFCGDVNTAHHEIDLARPKENEKMTGFLPIERQWLDEVEGAGYVDVYRHFYPNKRDVYTYWDQKTRARDRNVGWRIDYFFVTQNLLPAIKKIEILANLYGSDHCPVSVDLEP